MTIELIRLHRLNIPLVRPFRTSFGTEVVRDVILVEAVSSDGIHGWGECVTMSWPGYSYEYSDTAIDVITRHLLPALSEISDDNDPLAVRSDVWLRQQSMSLAAYFGAGRSHVPSGVSVGIPTSESVVELLDEVEGYIDAGYRRIKLKIEPGWDREPVAAVRGRWPDIPLQTDANQAYLRSDAAHLASFDEFGLLLHEQPLHEEDLYGHVLLSEACATPICLDESIHSVASADSAIHFGATSIINIKPARGGGYITAQEIHDLCLSRGIPVCAANLALAALPGFTLPGDTSASNRYYKVDVTEPFVLQDGGLSVPTGPGIGVDPIPEVLADLTVWSQELRPA
ncbi:MAG: o-succinylbenzoate synthase [Actinobacteria bacterium]|nr:o-succinylbenzoate synthase [Actinomycetota bacterium]